MSGDSKVVHYRPEHVVRGNPKVIKQNLALKAAYEAENAVVLQRLKVDDAFDKQDSATNVFHKQRLLDAAIAELRILEELEKTYGC